MRFYSKKGIYFGIDDWMQAVRKFENVHNRLRGCSLLVQWKLRIGFFISLFTLMYSSLFGQFGNEWINYNQSYYKIPITKAGIYRLTYSDLNSAGLPVNTIDPRRIQIFRRGVEQSINFKHNEAPADGLFESGEYLEFYGEKNDGATDVDLYKNPAHHPHPYINLYSDTAAYFLTWNLLPIQGKRMNNLNPVVNVDNLPVEVGFNNTILNVFNDQYFQGTTYLDEIQSSFFDEGEGWTGNYFCNGANGCTGQKDFQFQLTNTATTLSPPEFELLMVGRANLNHSVEVYVGPDASSLRLVSGTSFQFYKNAKVNSTLQWTDFANDGSITVRVKLLASTKTDFISVSYIKIGYNRSFDLGGLTSQTIELLPNGGNESYVEIQNASVGLRLFDITDITNASLLGTYSVGAKQATVINGTISSRKIFAASSVITPTIKGISFGSIQALGQNYIIISNKVLHKPALGVSDPVKAYSDYRASIEGGNYDTLTVNVDQLYNQFNYGETSSRAIYQFLKYMSNGGNPKYVFLIGKGLELNFAYDRNRTFLPTDLKDLVPTAGFPGADLNYTAGLEGASIYEPGIPVGRLAANSPIDIVNYLNKVKETEALPFDVLWRKNILHLSGGINTGEPELFKYYIDGFKTIASDLYYGASVSSKSKRSLSLETIPIADQVNAGLSLITFFGHSATTQLDFDIGFVTNSSLGYNNKGKYPAFLINGCNVGRIFDNRAGNARSFGEDWMAAQDKGARAFIANSSFGEPAMLRFYTDSFYKIGMADSISLSRGIGDIQKDVAKLIFSITGTRTESLAVMYQMVLMGDPAVKLFGPKKADFAIQNSFLSKHSLDGTPITSATKSFGINYKIRNYGQARKDSLKVTLERTLPDKSIIVYDTIVAPVYYENDFVFLLPNLKEYSGQNVFKITIDSNMGLAELNENNNVATISLFIPGSATYNLVPYNFSIVNSTNVKLKFQNTNQIPIQKDYELQLDTVLSFNSPFLKTKKISAIVLGIVSLDLLSKDSVVYYWRTKLSNPSQNESADWFTSSFSYIMGSLPGWSQMRNDQISFDNFNGVVQSTLNAGLAYPDNIATVFVQNFGSANPNPYTNTSMKVNGEELNLLSSGQPCRPNTINIVAFDKATGSTYAGIPFKFVDPRTCGRQPQVINSFTLTEVEDVSNGLSTVITNIAANDSVVVFTIGDAGIQNYSSTLLNKLGEIGISSSQLAGLQPGEPLIVFGKKSLNAGDAKVFRPTDSPLNEQELVVNKTITSRVANGSLTSVVIGPAKSWGLLSNKIRNIETSDDYKINIIGISTGNMESNLYSGKLSNLNLSFIDASLYPNIKLELITNDLTNLTPVDLKHWIVYYSPEPEGILLFKGGPETVSVQEGQTWKAQYTFRNLTDYSFANNSLDVEMIVTNKENLNTLNHPIQIASPLPLDSTQFDWTIETISWAGDNSITATVNTGSVPEQYNFNNSIELESYLKVIPDRQPPVLDVTVDGRYLSNGDFVSHNPNVKILIHDENIYRFKSDTTGIQILFTDLDTDEVQRVNFSNLQVHWRPATVDSDFMIDFTEILDAGNYELSIQASDASGNFSGTTPYKVSFVVSNDLSVVLGDPYPNPSSDTFIFPIKLAGNELPDSFSFKVFSADGNLIDQYTLSDVSGFFIGSNDLKWKLNQTGISGTSGVYFYRMELSVSGKSFSKSGRLINLH